MRILVVEDEQKTGEYLKKGLGESGFVVDVVANGIDGEHLATTEDYDLVVLDVMLPGKDGWHVMEAIRKHKEVPVLVLSARDPAQDRIKSYGLGADRYLTKPFSFSELLVRIRTLTRQGRQRAPSFIRIGDLEIDVCAHSVRRGGRSVDLTAKEFTLLHVLALHAGEVVSRSRIASEVWGMNTDSDTRVVDVAMGRLRAKVDDEYSRQLIHTFRGVGYVLEERA